MRNILYIISFFLFFCVPIASSQPSTSDAIPDTALAGYFYQRGIHFSNNANQDSSIIFFEKAGNIYHAFASQHNDSTSWENYIRSLNALSYNFRTNGNYDSALTIARKALHKGLALFGESNRVVGLSYEQIGLIQNRMGKHKEALEMMNNGLAIKKKTLGEKHPKVADSYRYIGITHEHMNDFKKASEYFNKALDIKRAHFGDDHLSVIQLYKDMAIIYREIGDYEKSLAYFKIHLNGIKKQKGNDPLEAASTFLSMGILYRIKGDYDKALDSYKKALPIYTRHFGENHLRTGSVYNNMGVIYSANGDYIKALEYYQKFLSIMLDALGEMHPNVAGAYYNIGNIYRDIKDYDRALVYHQKALDLRLALYGENHRHVAASYNELGQLYNDADDLNQALDYHKKSMAIYKKIFGSNHILIGMGYAYAGMIFQKQDMNEQAGSNFLKALDIYIRHLGKHHPWISFVYRSLGELALDENRPDEALNYAQKACNALIPGFKDSSWYVNPALKNILSEKALVLALKLKALAFHKRFEQHPREVNDLKASLNAYQKAMDLIELIRYQYQYEKSKLLLSEETQDIDNGAIWTALMLYELTQNITYKEEVFNLIEKAKSSVLLTSLQDSKAMQFAGISETLLKREKELRIDLTFYETQIQNELQKKEGQDSLKIKAYENQRFRLNTAYEKLIQSFETDYPGYYDLKYQTETVPVTKLQNHLDEKTAFIEYFLSVNEVIIYVIASNRTDVYRIPVNTNFEILTETMTESIKKLNRKTFYKSSYALYQKLIKPIQHKLTDCEKLIIIPHGILYKIPFETLISGIPANDNVDYLINHFDISYHYSATLYSTTLKETNNMNKQHRQAFCGFAPVFSDYTENHMAAQINRSDVMAESGDSTIRSLLLDGKRMRELSYSENEVKQIVKLYQKNKQSATGYYHEAASESTFKKEIGQCKNVHIATHSIMNESNPRLSSIIFSQDRDNTEEDGILYSGETYNLNLNAELIVLSSCESGMGKLIRGEGLMALTRGFLYSGADNLVVSLWKISDKHTSDLMITFYENMISGNDYAASLRNAKLKMVKNKKTAFPKSWAGFILIGE